MIESATQPEALNHPATSLKLWTTRIQYWTLHNNVNDIPALVTSNMPQMSDIPYLFVTTINFDERHLKSWSFVIKIHFSPKHHRNVNRSTIVKKNQVSNHEAQRSGAHEMKGNTEVSDSFNISSFSRRADYRDKLYRNN